MANSLTTKTLRDRDHNSFVESPSRSLPYTAREVFVGNSDQNPIPVIFTEEDPQFQYNSLVVAAGGFNELLGKIQVAGKESKLTQLFLDGDNIARYEVVLNGDIIVEQKTYYTKFNTTFNLFKLRLNPSDVFKVNVENNSDSPAEFRATLVFSEKDL